MGNCNCLSQEEKEPILLTQDHLAKLIVEDCHKWTPHSGASATLIQMRTQIWIPRERSFIQKFLRKCNTCICINSKSYRYSDQPALPSYRINSAPPFSAVGYDYRGHLFIKSNAAKQSRAYIAVFACCITRAVHLKLVTDSTIEQFLLAFRYFCAGKSVPTTVVSDNATYFISGESVIKTILEYDAIQQHFSKHQIKWINIPGRSPALYEWLVGIVTNILKKILTKALLTQTELHTIVKETEATVNNRPWTYRESDTSPMSPTPLTPSHLINGRILSTLPHLGETEDNIIENITPSWTDNNRRIEAWWSCRKGDRRPRRKAFTHALKCLKILCTMMKRSLSPWGVCRELQMKLTHNYVWSKAESLFVFSPAESKAKFNIFLNETLNCINTIDDYSLILNNSTTPEGNLPGISTIF